MTDRYGYNPRYNPSAPAPGGYPPSTGFYPAGAYPPPPAPQPATFVGGYRDPHPPRPYVSVQPARHQPTTLHTPHQWNRPTGRGHVESKPFYWVDWDSNRMVPPTAVQGGVDRDGSTIYVGRAYHEGDWIPAKVIPGRHCAYVAYAGGEHQKHQFQVLCEQRFDWVPTSGGNIPPGAVEGGRTSDGEILYIGRVWHDGTHTVGKVHPSHGSLYIPYDSTEMAFSTYEILVLRT